MRRFPGFVLMLLTAAAAASGQQLTEKIDVNLVNVDVTVTAKGHSIQGLTKDDFEIREDGVVQPITNFYAVENPSAAAAAGATSHDAPTDDRFRRKVLVIVDYAHTSKINRNRALEKLEKFIADRFSGQYDWSIAIAASDMKIVLPLTSDKSRIHACIEAMRNDAMWQPSPEVPPMRLAVRFPFLDPAEAMIDTTYTAVAFRAVRDGARAFAGAEGKKIILLISSGFGKGMDVNASEIPSRSFGAAAAAVASTSRQMMTLRDELIREANASNLNVYCVNPEGMGGSSALYWMGRQTGGALLAGNYPERSFRQFDELSSNFYSLAYRPQHPEDLKYHRISVSLRKSGPYKLQYRDGYGSLPIEMQLERTLASPYAATMQTAVIPMSLTPGQPRGMDGKLLLPVTISVALKDLQFVPSRSGSDARVNVFVSVFDAEGRNLGVQRFVTGAHAKIGEPTDHGELIENATLRLKRGRAHTIVVAVHDQVTDSVGVAKQRLEF